MMEIYQKFLRTGVCLAPLLFSPYAGAVGNGVDFLVEENNVPALNNTFEADSMDFTYHSCVEFDPNDPMRFTEKGYFWISSYQDADSVLDSQINTIGNRGYHIYGIYQYSARQFGNAQNTPTGNRLNYATTDDNADIELYVDPQLNTSVTLAAVGCDVVVNGDADDFPALAAGGIIQGEKSETNGLANGDFKLVFGTPMFHPNLRNPLQPIAGNLYYYLVFNGNITQLQGVLGDDHKPEGSGNLFFLPAFDPLPWNGQND